MIKANIVIDKKIWEKKLKKPEIYFKKKLYKLSKLPFKIMEKAPIRDKIMPANWSFVVLVLNNSQEKPIIITGAIEAINVELITIEERREI